jgi:hypothetical protein
MDKSDLEWAARQCKSSYREGFWIGWTAGLVVGIVVFTIASAL